MTNIIPFDFKGHKVTVIKDDDGALFFVAMEAAEILGYSDAFEMTKRLDDDEKQNRQIAGFGNRGVTVISESGLYDAILGSIKPQAKPFQKWVRSEVLPSIRKTGSYSMAPVDVTDVFADPNILRTALLGYTEKVIALEGKVADLEPKAAALEQISAGKESLTMTQAAKVLGIKQDDLTSFMHAKKWVYRQNGSWVAYDTHIRNGDLKYKEAKYTDETTGQEVRRPYCHILPKGLTKLARLLNGEREAA